MRNEILIPILCLCSQNKICFMHTWLYNIVGLVNDRGGTLFSKNTYQTYTAGNWKYINIMLYHRSGR